MDIILFLMHISIKPIPNELRKQNRRLVVAGMHLLGRVVFQPAKFYRIGKASHEYPVMIKRFIRINAGRLTIGSIPI